MEARKVLSPFSIFFIATFVVLCYYEGGNSVMYELSHLCVDRTFLLIYWDPSCVKAGNMPFHLVVRCLDRGTHLLEFAGSILREKERHLRILPILY